MRALIEPCEAGRVSAGAANIVREKQAPRHTHAMRVFKKEKAGRAYGLQFRADVRVDLTVQANFFECGCGPLHDEFSQSLKTFCLERRLILSAASAEINSPCGENSVVS